MNDNQHYVSKAHLDKFVHPASGQKVLYPYVRGMGPQSPRGTKRLASANHFYRQIENGMPTNMLDEARKGSETLLFASGKRTSGSLAKVIYDDTFRPRESDKVKLAAAAAFLRCGAPVQVHNTAMMALMCQQQFLFNQLNTEKAKQVYRDKYGDEADQKIQEDREAIWKGRLVADVGEENWKQLGFSSYQTEGLWLETLSQMGLTVCASHPKSVFITSDNPVILTCQSQIDSPGLGLSDAEVWFPVSYRKGLLWTRKHTGIDRTILGHSETRVRNRNMIKWCYREVYSPLPEDWIGSAVKESTFDPCYGHYDSLEKVAEENTLHVVDKRGKQREIVDLFAALRAAPRLDVLGLRR